MWMYHVCTMHISISVYTWQHIVYPLSFMTNISYMIVVFVKCMKALIDMAHEAIVISTCGVVMLSGTKGL